MTLADILAAVGEVMDPSARESTLKEMLEGEGVDLEALRGELVARADELVGVGAENMTDEQILESEIIAQALTVLDEVAADKGEDAAEDTAEGDEAAVNASADDERATRAQAAAEALARTSVKKTEPVTEPAVEAAPALEAAAQTAEAEEDNTVTASGNNTARPVVPLNKVEAEPQPSDSVDPRRIKHTIIAAGDLPGYGNRELLDMKSIAAAVHSGMSHVSRTQTPGLSQGLATIRREAPDHLTYNNEADYRKVDAVTDARNLPGGQGLTAAGGWCAPSEVLYDTCPITVSTDGMVDLPTITASRGGIKYSGKPDFGAIWRNTGFIQTEADAIAGVLKPCYEIPCPDDLSECRMDISGICLKQPILTEIGWPEKVEEFVEYAMLAHAHKMNAERIRRMVALATYSLEVPAPANPQEASIFDPHGPGAFESVLSVLELQVEFFRYSGRLARNVMLEAIAPFWLRGILRADISKKLGIDDRWGAGADAALDRWFADRGVRIQYVYDWQDALADQDDSSFGGTVPTQWPTQVQILLYEPGTFFALQQDVITLSGIYDSVDLQKNVYTRLFTEEGFQVCTRCGRSLLLTLNLCPNGLSGTQQRTQCEPVAVPA